jgi:hypothetical protein
VNWFPICFRSAREAVFVVVFSSVCCLNDEARGQAQPPGQDAPAAARDNDKGERAEKAKADDQGAAGKARDRAAGGGGEASAAYQESLRKTVERRRERRARRQRNGRDSSSGAVGAIVPWLMPPALIIRHTREVHDEVDSLLYGLRR